MSDNAPQPRCIHFYCKAMMVYGEEFESDPDYQAGMSDLWCLKTQEALGPDREEVSLELCSEPERGCYQPH